MSPYRKKKLRSKPRKGIYLLPNLFTAACLFSGFFAIIAAIQGQYDFAAVAILIAALCDALDGRIARLTNTTTPFGTEFDSLADLAAFGVAPAVLAFQWCLNTVGRLGWLAAFMLVICGALRLARFNVQKQIGDPNYFKGLPIPAAAFLIAAGTLFMKHLGISIEDRALVFMIMIYGLSFLMVSTIPYPSFKKVNLKNRKPFHILVGIILVSLVVAYRPSITLFFIMVVYVLAGPANAIYRFKPERFWSKDFRFFVKKPDTRDRAYEHMLDLNSTRETDRTDD